MSEASPPDVEELGGRYRVERELGRGGTSTVFLARDRVYDRRVAVKVLRSELALSLGVDRFLREIRVTARLNHPHIAPVIDSGVGGGWCYFVTTYLEGGTLRRRLEQERQLAIDDAVGITRVIAGALDYAHGQGVLHCDVKPENILFSNGEPFLTDFGIARLFEAEHLGSTSTGIVRGTPTYMSPEQAGGEKGYDGRTDVYSLACVLYEMLAGVPAFVGATPQAVLTQRFLHAPRELRVYRPTVPRHIEAAIARAMAVSPAERFATAGEFAEAVRMPSARAAVASSVGEDPVRQAVGWRGAAPGSQSASRGGWRARSSVLAALALAAAGVAGAWVASARGWLSFGDAATGFDAAPTIVFPFVREGVRQSFSGEDLYLHDALARWRGLRVVDVPRARGLYAGRDSARFGVGEARELARKAGARRFVWGRIVERAGAPVIVASLYDVKGDDEPVRTTSIAVPSPAIRDSVFDYLASELAFGPTTSLGATGLAGTRSGAARAAYARGIQAVSAWALDRADSSFAAALAADRDYAQALLWRAHVAGWRSDPSPAWRELARDAVQREAFLGARDRAHARAVYFHSSGQFPKACPIYRQLAATDAQDFVAWFGLAECLRHDEVVVLDSASESGWRFRTSYAEALRAYQQAFALLPAVGRGYRSHAFTRLQTLLYTQSARLRRGHAEADGQQFGAYAAWVGDSLTFVPYPVSLVSSARPSVTPASATQAIEQNRRLFRQITEAWAQALPRDAGMLEGVAVARDLEGDSTGISVMRRALALAAPNERLGLTASLIWMEARHGCMGADDARPRIGTLTAARRLADSVLRATPRPPTDGDLAPLLGLAALTGRPELGADLARRYARPVVLSFSGRPTTVSARIVGQSSAFLIYAAVGAPADSIVELAHRADAALRSDLSEDVQREARQALLPQAVALAYPAAGRVLTLDDGAREDYLLAAEDALAAGKPRRVKELLREVRAARRHLRPADLTFDALYPEAWMLAQLGDSAGALAWIAPSLDALAGMPPQLIESPAKIASLVRGMTLRSDLARAAGDRRDASAWEACVAALWEPGPHK